MSWSGQDHIMVQMLGPPESGFLDLLFIFETSLWFLCPRFARHDCPLVSLVWNVCYGYMVYVCMSVWDLQCDGLSLSVHWLLCDIVTGCFKNSIQSKSSTAAEWKPALRLNVLKPTSATELKDALNRPVIWTGLAFPPSFVSPCYTSVVLISQVVIIVIHTKNVT